MTTPQGIVPIFLTAASCAIFQCKPEIDVTQALPFVWIGIDKVVEDVATRRVISDFQPVKEMLVKSGIDKVLLIYDFEWKYGQNFYICMDQEMALKLTTSVE
eukprot:Partr_v1_DN27008_c0_g1_i1_m28826 putative NA